MKIITNGMSDAFEKDVPRIVSLIDASSLGNKDKNTIRRVMLAVKKLKMIDHVDRIRKTSDDKRTQEQGQNPQI